jgi:hypothetical protein
MCRELDSVFEAAIRAVTYVQNSPDSVSYVMIWRQNTWCSHTITKRAGSPVPKCFQGIWIEGRKPILLSDSNKNNVARIFFNEDFIQKFAYFVDIFKNMVILLNQCQILKYSDSE